MKNSDLLKKSPIYDNIYLQMLSYQYAYLGGLPFKMTVRKKRPSEDSTLWNDLVNNTIAQPICRYIVDTINDVLFEPGIKRNVQFCTPQGTYINPDNSEWAELFLLDADLNNNSLNGFMEHIGDLSSIYGHCWVAVDMPQASQGNLGRPYVCAVNPLDVWDWEFEYYGGKPILKYVKVKESEDQETKDIIDEIINDYNQMNSSADVVLGNMQDAVKNIAVKAPPSERFSNSSEFKDFQKYGACKIMHVVKDYRKIGPSEEWSKVDNPMIVSFYPLSSPNKVINCTTNYLQVNMPVEEGVC